MIRLVAWLAIALGLATFATWTSAVWQDSPGTTYWKVTGVLGIWTAALLIGTTLRLIASSQRLLVTAVPATWATATLAAVIGTEMAVGDDSGPWRLVVVVVILTALGYALTPALQRFWAAEDQPAAAERLLGTLGNIEVFAVRGEGRSVTIGASRTRLASSEGIVLRERS